MQPTPLVPGGARNFARAFWEQLLSSRYQPFIFGLLAGTNMTAAITAACTGALDLGTAGAMAGVGFGLTLGVLASRRRPSAGALLDWAAKAREGRRLAAAPQAPASTSASA